MALLEGHDPVLVVGVFGKPDLFLGHGEGDSAGEGGLSQDGMLDHFLQRDVFTVSSDSAGDSSKSPYVQGYVDRDNGRIFLSLRGLCDASSLADEVDEAVEEVREEVTKLKCHDRGRVS